APLEVASLQHSLGLSLVRLGELELAINLFEKALVTRKAKLGPTHRDTLAALHNLASAYGAAAYGGTSRLPDKALPLLEDSLRLTKEQFGLDHADTLGAMNNLAIGYLAS